MNIAILDDEPIYLEQMKNIITSSFSDASISTFTTVNALLCANTDVDLLLLDIELPQMDGITLADVYQNRFPNIIFITTHDELVYDAFGKNILGFIKKSEMQEKLMIKIKEFIAKQEIRIVLNTSKGFLTCPANEILYFYYEDAIIHVKTVKQTIILNYRSLKQLQSVLDEKMFCFIDRNVIVNITQIIRLRKVVKEVELINHKKFNVSKRNWPLLLSLYQREVLK